MAKSSVAPASQATLAVLVGTVISVTVIGGLYWAQTVLVPVALAVFLAFPLAPLVTALQRRRMGRIPSVILVVMLATLVLGGVLWIVKVELTGLANDLPTYTENIQGKVKYLRQMGHGAGMERLGKMAEDISGEWEKTLANIKGASKVPSEGASPAPPEKSPTAVIPPENTGSAAPARPQVPAWLSWLPSFLNPVMASLASLALTLVLVVFMLLEREALRNRLIRLVGDGHMTTATKALDDAGSRISRYLLMQLAVNGSYGLAWGLGLWLIGVEYAVLWGFLAAALRYVPYVGAPLAGLFPIALSLIQFPGWWQPIAVIGFFLVLELVSNNAVEPWLYGHSIGVSPVAMLVSAAFWAFLWGPIGLILSGPLTVCLVVLGKHSPSLEFLVVLLGDEPALAPEASYYQRLLARDQDEATQLVLKQAKTYPPEQVYDELLVQALIHTRRDREAGELSNADEEFVLQATHEMLEDLGERRSVATLAAAKEAPDGDVQAPPAKVRLLACPARDRADRLALEMLCQLLNPAEWNVEVTALETLTAELVQQVDAQPNASPAPRKDRVGPQTVDTVREPPQPRESRQDLRTQSAEPKAQPSQRDTKKRQNERQPPAGSVHNNEKKGQNR